MEIFIAAVSAVLIVDPIGHLWIRSCRTQWLSDWYTVLYNPTPDYRESLRCTQEAVYPLYVLFIFYTIDYTCLSIMLYNFNNIPHVYLHIFIFGKQFSGIP